MSPSFFKNSFQGTNHLAHIGPSFLQTMFQNKQGLIWHKWERFLSIIGKLWKTSFIYYKYFKVLEKCKKYSFCKRVVTCLEWLWKNHIFFYLESPNEFIGELNDNWTKVSFQWAMIHSIWSFVRLPKVSRKRMLHFFTQVIVLLPVLGDGHFDRVNELQIWN